MPDTFLGLNRLKRLGGAIKSSIRGNPTHPLRHTEAQSPPLVQASVSSDSKSSQVTSGSNSRFERENLSATPAGSPSDQNLLEISEHAGPSGPGKSPSILPGAHDFVMINPTFVSGSDIVDSEKTAVMNSLMEARMSGGELDSSARFPQPICHPGTRQAIRERTFAWLNNPNREANLLWIHGPAGVGKTTIAQTIGQYCKDQGWFGTSFFLSRSHSRDDPTRLVPTIAYQLSTSYPAYQRNIVRMLKDEPTILEKVLHTQFTKLITEPLFHIQGETPSKDPIVIILDGLDECHGDAAQRELIKLAGEFTTTAHRAGLSLLWVITSRPEWQITSTFADEDHPIRCRKEELLVRSPEAENDVTLYLREEFKRILHKYTGDVFSKSTVWPTESQFLTIRVLASGLFVFASTLLRFIDDDAIANPAAQLNLCLDFLKGGNMLDGGDPLNPLHSLYSGILRNIHPNILPTTMRVLFFSLVTRPSHPLQGVANLLLLNQADFYASLRRLHSVLSIPSPQLAALFPIQAFHTSFLDFVKRVVDSGAFGIQRNDIDKHISHCCIYWSRKWLETRSLIKGDGDTAEMMPWYYRDSYNATIRLTMELLAEVWFFATDEQLPDVVNSLCNVNLADFQACYGEPRSPLMRISAASITTLLVYLTNQQEKIQVDLGYSLIRTEPKCATDREIFRQCADFINYNGMESGDIHRIMADVRYWDYKFLSTNNGQSLLRTFWTIREAFLNPRPMFFLLGYEANTCLVIAYRRVMSVQQYLTESFQLISTTYYSKPLTLPEIEIWPLQADLELIASISPNVAMGLDVHSSLIRRIMAFVGSSLHRNPVERLERIIQGLHNKQTPGEILGSIREHELSAISPGKIRVANDVIALLITYPDHHRHHILVQDVTSWLTTEGTDFNKIFELLNITVSQFPLLFPMRTLLDIVSTAELRILEEDSRLWLRISSLYIHMYGQCVADMNDTGGHQSPRQLSDSTTSHLLFSNCWLAFDHGLTSSTAAQEMCRELRDFPFAQLDYFYSSLTGKPLDSFCSFVEKMWKFQADDNSEKLIRLNALSKSDDPLLSKRKGFGSEYQNIDLPPDLSDVCRIQFLTLDHNAPLDLSEPEMEIKSFLLGYDSNSCLVVTSNYR